MKHCGIYNEDGEVVNRITLEEGAEYTPPAGHYLIDDENANIGDRVVDGQLLIHERRISPDPEPQSEIET